MSHLVEHSATTILDFLSTMKVSKEWRKSCTENHMKNVAKGDSWHSGDFGDAGAPSDGKIL